MTDKKIIRISSVAIFVVLLVTLLLPLGNNARIVSAVFLLPVSIAVSFVLKKRNILSINKGQVLMIMSVIAIVYITLYYLTGIKFGFYKNPYSLTIKNLFAVFIPIIAIVVSTEILRFVMVAQNSKIITVISYFCCVISELLIVSDIVSVNSYVQFINYFAGALFPALIANLLFNYLSSRYGLYPNLVYRLVTTLYLYVIPIRSGISDAMLTFFRLLIPIAIYVFIDALYEKKRRRALANNNILMRVALSAFTVLALIIMAGTIMLISNQFKYGALVIVTDSMTGEIDRGDVVLYESYDGQKISEGQVIVFEKDGSMVVHRVIDIEIINGAARYYTKGDANDFVDSGHITNADVVGFVQSKIRGVGYPTLWLRSLFKR